MNRLTASRRRLRLREHSRLGLAVKREREVKTYGIFGADHVVWGTDCLWWGSPQWVIDAMKRFQISDKLCEKFGYKKLTKEDCRQAG